MTMKQHTYWLTLTYFLWASSANAVDDLATQFQAGLRDLNLTWQSRALVLGFDAGSDCMPKETQQRLHYRLLADLQQVLKLRDGRSMADIAKLYGTDTSPVVSDIWQAIRGEADALVFFKTVDCTPDNPAYVVQVINADGDTRILGPFWAQESPIEPELPVPPSQTSSGDCSGNFSGVNIGGDFNINCSQ